MAAFWFRSRTLRFRHHEAFQFFVLNILLQLIPFGVALLELAAYQVRLDPLEHTEAAWTLLAFGMWNAPASIRRDPVNPARTERIRIIIYSMAFTMTFVIFWVMFEAPVDRPDPTAVRPIYMAAPLVLAVLACIVLGVVNHSLLRRVSIRLLWRHQAQFAGIYVAKYYGHFQKLGLHVDIKPADPKAINSALDHFGGCQFAIVSSTDVVKARSKGIKMRALLVIVPEPAITFMAREESEIRTFADFKGRSVSYRKGYEEADVLRIMLHSVDLSLDDVTSVTGSTDCEEFIAGEVDIVAGHEAVEPLALAHLQVFVQRIAPVLGEHPIFADTLVTTEQTIRVSPALVRAMSAAVQSGWAAVAESPERGVEATLYEQRDHSSSNRAFQAEMQDAMLGLRGGARMQPVNLLPFGSREGDWLPIIQGMEAAGLVPSGLRANEMYWL